MACKRSWVRIPSAPLRVTWADTRRPGHQPVAQGWCGSNPGSNPGRGCCRKQGMSRVEHEYQRNVVLLGAGASAAVGLPDSVGLTQALQDHFAVSERIADRPSFIRVLNFVIGELAAERGQAGLDPLTGIDVERVIAAIDLLADRSTSPAAPFVRLWHPTVEAFEARDDDFFSSFLASDGLKKAMRAQRSDRRAAGIEAYLAEKIAAAMPTSITEAARGASLAARVALREVLAGGPTRPLTPLEPLAEVADELGPLCVATLNYDLVIETLGTTLGVPVHTGVGLWQTAQRLDAPEGGIHLLKLHGSIDWSKAPESDPLAASLTIDWNADLPPFLVFGEGNKLTAEGPFLDLLMSFQTYLRMADQLVVVGYSFRDQHVNEVIGRWLRAGGGRMTVIDPAFPVPDEWASALDNPFIEALLQLAIDQPGRLTVHPNKVDAQTLRAVLDHA